jgi:hypothetical protein
VTTAVKHCLAPAPWRCIHSPPPRPPRLPRLPWLLFPSPSSSSLSRSSPLPCCPAATVFSSSRVGRSSEPPPKLLKNLARRTCQRGNHSNLSPLLSPLPPIFLQNFSRGIRSSRHQPSPPPPPRQTFPLPPFAVPSRLAPIIPPVDGSNQPGMRLSQPDLGNGQITALGDRDWLSSGPRCHSYPFFFHLSSSPLLPHTPLRGIAPSRLGPFPIV